MDLAAARVDLKSTKKKLKTSKEKVATARSERDALQLERDETVAALTSAKAAAEHDLATARTRNESLETELDDERRLRREAETAQTERSNELKECEANLAATQRQLEKITGKAENLTEENQGLARQLQEATTAVLDLTTQKDRAVAEIRSGCFQSEAVVTQLTSLQASLGAIIGGEAALATIGSPVPRDPDAAAPAAADHDESDDDGETGFFAPGPAAGQGAPVAEGAAGVAAAIEQFRKRLTEVQQITSNLTSSGSAAAAKNADRVMTLEELEAKNKGAGVQKRALQDEVDSLTEELKGVKTKLDELTEVHEAKVAQCEELQTQATDLMGQVGTQAGELEIQRVLVDELNGRVATAESDLQNARSATLAL